MPKSPDPVRRLQGQRDYYRRAATYDAARIRELSRDLAVATLQRDIPALLTEASPLTDEQTESIVSLLRGAVQ